MMGEEKGRKRLASESTESQRRWRSIAENPFDFVVIIDRDYKYTFVNHTAPGVKMEDLIGKTTPFDFVGEAHHADMRKAFETTFGENRATSYEVYVPQMDRWFHSIVGPIRQDEEVVAASILTRDVTDGKRAEVALIESERRLKMALDASEHALFDMDVASGETFLSDRFYTLLGYEPGDSALRGHVDEFEARLHDADKAAALRALKESVADGQPFDHEYRLRKKDGTFAWFRGRGRPIDAPDGSKRFTGLLLDISAAKAATAERERLEEHVQEAQKLDTIGRLAGGIAHDFNNLLGPIMLHAELALKDGSPEGELKDHLEGILKASTHARELVSQILTFARRSGSQSKTFDLAHVVGEVLGVLKVSLPDNVQLQTDLGKSAHPVTGDAGQIRQVLVNLCTNAFAALTAADSASSGKVIVGIENIDIAKDEPAAGGVLKAGKYVCLSVQDDGPGIPAEARSRIFEPFFTTRGTRQGTGLGLAVVHGIVNRHGGAIQLTSDADRGTTFRVFIPLAGESVAGDDEPHSESPLQTLGDAVRVLCVDDDQRVLNVLLAGLRGDGFKVSAFSDAKKALEAFKEKPDDFDVVLSDVNMPGIRGDRLVQAVHQIRPKLPVILMTGFSDSVDPATAKAMGVAGYLEKPFSLDSLLNAVTSAANNDDG